MNHTCLCLPSRSWYSFTDPRRDGRLSWPWVAGWLHTEINVRYRELNPDTVAHLSTNQARRRLTSLIETNTLTATPHHRRRRRRAVKGTLREYVVQTFLKPNHGSKFPVRCCSVVLQVLLFTKCLLCGPALLTLLLYLLDLLQTRTRLLLLHRCWKTTKQMQRCNITINSLSPARKHVNCLRSCKSYRNAHIIIIAVLLFFILFIIIIIITTITTVNIIIPLVAEADMYFSLLLKHN